MDSDDEVIGAQYSSGKRLRADTEKPYDSLTLEAPELESPDVGKATLLRVVWARVKGFPPWPVSPASRTSSDRQLKST